MECITVLKNPEPKKGNIPHLNDVRAGECQPGICRLCSHRNQTVIFVTLVVVILILFSSQLILHLELEECKRETAHLKAVVKDLLEARDIEQINLEYNVHERHRAKQDGSARRRQRRNHGQCHIPHFFLYGPQQGDDEISSENGVFFWQNEDVNSDSFNVVKHYAYDDDTLDGLQIKRGGMYYIFAQVHVRGRASVIHNRLSTAVGLSLRKRRGSLRSTDDEDDEDVVLNSAFITQDNTGSPYRNRRSPVDVIQLSGVYYLDIGDEIYISRPYNDEYNNNYIYVTGDGFGHFGGFLVEPTGPCIH